MKIRGGKKIAEKADREKISRIEGKEDRERKSIHFFILPESEAEQSKDKNGRHVL